MYTLSKAKEEIDTIAQYAVSIAEHTLATNDGLNARFESFKQDVLAHIDAKFAELQKAIVGEQQIAESSAVSDLAAKVALLKPTPATDEGAHEQHAHHDDQGHQDHGGWH